MSHSFLALQELGSEPTSDDLYPIVSPSLEFQLDQGERILWEGSSGMMFAKRQSSPGQWKDAWKLSETSKICVTDRRLMYLCTKFDTGSVWVGGAAAAVLTGASALAAAHRRRGKVAVGQVRYQWPISVTHTTDALFHTVPMIASLALVCQDDTGPIRLTFTMPKAESGHVAEVLVKSMAAFRLRHPRLGPALSPEQSESLRAQAQAPAGTESTKRALLATSQSTAYRLAGARKAPYLG